MGRETENRTSLLCTWPWAPNVTEPTVKILFTALKCNNLWRPRPPPGSAGRGEAPACLPACLPAWCLFAWCHIWAELPIPRQFFSSSDHEMDGHGRDEAAASISSRRFHLHRDEDDMEIRACPFIHQAKDIMQLWGGLCRQNF